MVKNRNALIRNFQGEYLRNMLKELGIENINRFIDEALADYKKDMIKNGLVT
jgi:hypothetical protein